MTELRCQSAEPLVSVIMSVCNGSQYLGEAISSILRQTYPRLELIVVDDGSTDESSSILEGFARGDARVRVRRQINSGLTRSLNAAARMARGEVLARMDADDICLSDRLAKQVKWFHENRSCDAVGTQALRIDPDGWEIGEWRVPTDHESIDRQHISGVGGGLIHPTALIRRKAFEKIGGYDESLSAAQDYDLWLKLAENGKLANLDVVLLKYRLHTGSVSLSKRTEQEACMRRAWSSACARRSIPAGKHQGVVGGGGMAPDRIRRQWVVASLKSGNHATAYKHARLLWSESGRGLGAGILLIGSWLLSRWPEFGRAGRRHRGRLNDVR